MREIPALDLFMMCEKINTAAFGALPAGYFFRHPREDELDAWIRLNIEDEAHYDFVKAYYLRVYAPKKERFFKRCIFVCNEADIPIGTCFTWKSYEQFYTIHWLKVKKEYERKGVGRALLTHILSTLEESDNPIYLHTHPSSLAAIKLYTDFGFAFLTNAEIGCRKNGLQEALPYLKAHLAVGVYESLRFAEAPPAFLETLQGETEEVF